MIEIGENLGAVIVAIAAMITAVAGILSILTSIAGLPEVKTKE